METTNQVQGIAKVKSKFLHNKQLNFISNDAVSIDKKTYTIKVNVADKKNAGTDDPIYFIMFGPNGSTDKIHLDTKKNDFERNSESKFTYQARELSIGDIGKPFAITIILDGDDAIYIDNIQVEYKQGELAETSEFPIYGALGEKGDFKLTSERKGVTIFLDGTRISSSQYQKNVELGEYWIVADNRASSESEHIKQTKKQIISMSHFYGILEKSTHNLHIGLAVEKNNGWFGANYKFELSYDYTKEKQVENNSQLTKTEEYSFDVDTVIEPKLLEFIHYRISGKTNYEEHKVGANGAVNLDVLTGKPDFNNTGMMKHTFNAGVDIPDDLKVVYKEITGEDFKINH